MKYILKHKLIHFFLVYTFLMVNCYGQKNVDSLLRANSQVVLVNPDEGIKTLNSIFNDPEISTDDKIHTLMLISTAYTTKRDYQTALTTSLKILDYIPFTTNYKLKINAFNQIGGNYQQINLISKANEYLDKGLEVTLKHVENDTTLHGQLGVNYGLKGQLFREQLSTNKALNYFDKAIAEFHLVTDNERLKLFNLSVMHYNQAYCYLDSKDLENAKLSFEKSATYAKGINLASLVASIQKALAKLEAVNGNNQASLDILLSIENDLDNVKDLTIKSGLYYDMAIDYMLLNQPEKHATYFKKAITTQLLLASSKIEPTNKALAKSISNKSETLKDLHNRYSYYTYALLFTILILLLLFVKYHLKTKKKLTALQKEIKFKKDN